MVTLWQEEQGIIMDLGLISNARKGYSAAFLFVDSEN